MISKTDFILASGLAAANAIAFLHLGMFTRIPIWIFTFGFTDLAIGSGFFATAYWVPRAVAENDRDRRILIYSFWIIVGLVMTLPGIL